LEQGFLEALTFSGTLLNLTWLCTKKVPGSIGAKPSQVQQVPEKVAEKVPVQGQVRFQQVEEGF